MKIGSVKYLRMVSSAILKYDERWRGKEQLELSSRDMSKRDEEYQSLVDLAQEIKDAIGIEGKKAKDGDAAEKPLCADE